jgi:UDP-N-acetylglucosamine acyltransferase
MSHDIHSTAIVSKDAELGNDVSIGPFAIVGPGCVLSDGCKVAAHAVIERNATLGRNVKVGIGSIVGGDAQDLKYRGEETHVEIGDNTQLREYVTVNRGTAEALKTTVGKDCYLMSYSHVGHDCHVGDSVIISNACHLGGHVTVEEKAIISGVAAVHQFTLVGRYAFIGGCSRVTKDVPPYVKAVGNPIKLYGLNSVGLQRNGFPEDVVRELKRAYRLFFKSELNLTQARERAESELRKIPEIVEFLRFFERSERGAAI